MRLGTWNVQTGLDSGHAWAAIDELRANVLTVQECGIGTKARAEEDGWTCEWQPGRWYKGLAVLARYPYTIELREPSELPFCISTLIDGPERFRFVGFWAMTPKDVGLDYPVQATRLIEALPNDGLPTVLAGDFNASRSAAHLRNVERLRERGLVSAYHALNSAPHDGKEASPTSYYQWRRSRHYHMDFVFVPTAWPIESVKVGSFEDYPGRRLSDHVPVVVTTKA